MQHFGSPDTHFTIVRSETPVNEDGFKIGEPTGIIRCDRCGAEHENVDEIPHEPDCPQRFCHSYWYADMVDRG